MYAAAQAKPQSIEAEHLGPAAIPRPHLVATYKAGRDNRPYDTVRCPCRLSDTSCSFNHVVNFQI